MRERFLKIKGIAVLEAAGALTILLIILSGAYGFIEYMRLSRALDEALTNHLYNGALKPFSADYRSNAAPDINLNTNALSDYLLQSAQGVAQELEAEIPQRLPLAVELSFREVEIDPDSGRLLNHRKSFDSAVYPASDPQMLSLLQQKIDLEKKLDLYIKRKSSGPTAYFAVPQAGGISQAVRYLPSSVLVGAQVGISLEENFIGRFMQLFGQEPFLMSYKIISLRGEVSDEA